MGLSLDCSDRPWQLRFSERRALLDALQLGDGPWVVSPLFDDGEALWQVVCERGLEGLVGKRLSERYRPGERRWLKVKNPQYWRHDEEVERLQHSIASR